jgi:hypothetical protein
MSEELTDVGESDGAERNMGSIADRLYGGTKTTAPAAGREQPLNDIASRLYGGAVKAQQFDISTDETTTLQPKSEIRAKQKDQKATTGKAASRAPIDLKAIAERAYAKPVQTEASPTVPESVREMRNADSARRMFSPQGTYAGVEIEDGLKDLPFDEPIKQTVAAELREIFADFGASADDAQQLTAIARRRASSMPADADADAALMGRAVELMTLQYGKDAPAALKDARDFIARDPRIAKILDGSRLGNDPEMVLKIAELARSAKMRSTRRK